MREELAEIPMEVEIAKSLFFNRSKGESQKAKIVYGRYCYRSKIYLITIFIN